MATEKPASPEIDPPITPPAHKTKPRRATPVHLLRDYWGEDGVRQAAGTIVDVPVATARLLLAEGKAERADPLPQ